MREIKFRGRIAQGIENAGAWVYWGINGTDMLDAIDPDTIGQFTGLTDKNGVGIYEGDVLEFSDKWEWYRCHWGPKFLFADNKEKEELKKEFDALPMERRVVEYDLDEGYSFSHSDLNIWEVIGSIHETPELIDK